MQNRNERVPDHLSGAEIAETRQKLENKIFWASDVVQKYSNSLVRLAYQQEQMAAFGCEIWERFRPWGGVSTGATQNVKDLLSSPEIENILENSDFVCLLNQATGVSLQSD